MGYVKQINITLALSTLYWDLRSNKCAHKYYCLSAYSGFKWHLQSLVLGSIQTTRSPVVETSAPVLSPSLLIVRSFFKNIMGHVTWRKRHNMSYELDIILLENMEILQVIYTMFIFKNINFSVCLGIRHMTI